MNNPKNLKKYQESNSSKVGRWLNEKRFFYPANQLGSLAESFEDLSGLGILFDDTTVKPKTYLWGLIKIPPERRFIGIIFFNSEYGCSKTWHLQVHGKRYHMLCLLLAQELKEEFHVEIVVELVGSEILFETKPTPRYLLEWPY